MIMEIEGCPLIQKYRGHFRLDQGPETNFFVYLPSSELSNISPEAVKVLLTTCGDCLKCKEHRLVSRQFTPTLLREGNYLGILTPGFDEPNPNPIISE